MRFVFVAAFGLIALVSFVHCGCDNEARSPDDSDFSVFFKNLGCDFKKISDSAKPWVEKIEDSAKQLTDTVADKFSDLKTKISGSSESDVSTPSPNGSNTSTSTSTSASTPATPSSAAPVDLTSTPLPV